MSGLPTGLLDGGDSFYELLVRVSPGSLPTAGPADSARRHGGDGRAIDNLDPALLAGSAAALRTGTTILALTTASGVLMAGDRRATQGNVIASRHIEKVHPADDHAVIGIAGTAGLALELIKLFQLELEHYEKIAGHSLSLPGKANRLSAMLRDRLQLALGGLAVVPLLAGAEPGAQAGRIFSYDVTGGKYEESRFHAIGSGAAYARGALKKLWRPDLDLQAATRVAAWALLDAADDDSATGGPDLARGIAPQVFHVTGAGVSEIDGEAVLGAARSVLDERAGENGR